MRSIQSTPAALLAAILLSSCGTSESDGAHTADTPEMQGATLPAGNGEVRVVYDGREFGLEAFQCLRDYPSPIDPDRKVAIALDAAAPGTAEEFLKPLRGVPGPGSANPLEALPPLLAQGPVLSLARYADGMDVVTFYPTDDLEKAVVAMDDGGLLEISTNRIEGTFIADPSGNNAAKELTISAQCP